MTASEVMTRHMPRYPTFPPATQEYLFRELYPWGRIAEEIDERIDELRKLGKARLKQQQQQRGSNRLQTERPHPAACSSCGSAAVGGGASGTPAAAMLVATEASLNMPSTVRAERNVPQPPRSPPKMRVIDRDHDCGDAVAAAHEA